MKVGNFYYQETYYLHVLLHFFRYTENDLCHYSVAPLQNLSPTCLFVISG